MGGSILLGIESSCDETSVALVRDGWDVLANIIASQHELHEKFGGVVPEIASRAHIERILPVFDEALEGAGISVDRVDAVAVGHRPGLIGSLLVGVSAAKTLAWSLEKPLIGVDHIHAHLRAGAIERDPIPFPALGLVVSGGHTSLYAMRSGTAIGLLGRTIDDAVGEAYDKVANILGAGFPGGPVLDKRAARGNPRAVDFPRPLLGRESLDFSFSGLKTAVLYHVRGKPVGRGRHARFERDASGLTEQDVANVAASFQAAIMDVLATKVERAIRWMAAEGIPPRALVIGGGVSANSALRERAAEIGRDHGIDVRIPPIRLCLDNAAMIAALGHDRLEEGATDDLSLEAIATTELR